MSHDTTRLLTDILPESQVQVQLTIQRQWYTHIALDALLDAHQCRSATNMTDDEIDNKYNTNSEKYRQQAYLSRKINRQLDFPQASYTHTGHDLSKKQRGLTEIIESGQGLVTVTCGTTQNVLNLRCTKARPQQNQHVMGLDATDSLR